MAIVFGFSGCGKKSVEQASSQTGINQESQTSAPQGSLPLDTQTITSESIEKPATKSDIRSTLTKLKDSNSASSLDVNEDEFKVDDSGVDISDINEDADTTAVNDNADSL